MNMIDGEDQVVFNGDHTLLTELLATPVDQVWVAPARLRPVLSAGMPAAGPHWLIAQQIARPLSTVAALVLAGSLLAAGVGVSPVRAAHPVPASGASMAGLSLVVPARGALADLQIAPASRFVARRPALPSRAATAAHAADEALLASLLASEPADYAAPAVVSFVTVARLPDSVGSYQAAAISLPAITVAQNVVPPPPPPPPSNDTTAQQQPPPPPGYRQPPGYMDGVPNGGAPGSVVTNAPVASRPPTTTRPAPTRPAVPAPAPRPVATPAVHVVRTGDTLSAIALYYYGDARYAALIWELNYRLIGPDPNMILVGQRLTLPARPVVRPATTLPARGAIPHPSIYTIQPQDYLRWMAQRAYGNEMRWPEIYRANRNVLGPNPDLIYPGVPVAIP